jgi:hypothetical protein
MSDEMIDETPGPIDRASDEVTPPDAEAPPALPDPADRARSGLRGLPVVILGETWLLADYRPTSGGVWDKIYDEAVMGGARMSGDILLAAAYLLAENYELTQAEAFAVILQADPADILEPVRFALFGPEKETRATRRTLSQWERFGLKAARIDPAPPDPWEMRAFLDYLVELGAILPQDRWISSAEAVARRARRAAQE